MTVSRESTWVTSSRSHVSSLHQATRRRARDRSRRMMVWLPKPEHSSKTGALPKPEQFCEAGRGRQCSRPGATPVLAVRACGMPNGGHARGQSGPRRWRGPLIATRSARAPRPRARGCARGAPRGPSARAPPIAARRPPRGTSLSCPGQRGGGGGGLVTCGQAAPGEHREVGGPRVAGSCCLLDNVVHWTPNLPQV